MLIDSTAMVNISEVSQNFSRVSKLVDVKKKVIVMKNNKPKYIILEYPDERARVPLSDEDVKKFGKDIITENINLFKRLAE